jgi:Secretion system C-terminal sorting domain
MDDPNFVMFGLDRYDQPVVLVEDFKNDTGSTYPFLTNAYEVGLDYDNSMRYWVIDPDGIVRYRSGVHEQNISAQQTAIESELATLDVDDPTPIEQPAEFALINAYPNPFNATVTVQLTLPVSETIHVSVVDLLGREVAVLLNESAVAGRVNLSWSPNGLATGMYLLRVQGETATLTRKLMYLK